jgi:hypothetical protein
MTLSWPTPLAYSLGPPHHTCKLDPWPSLPKPPLPQVRVRPELVSTAACYRTPSMRSQRSIPNEAFPPKRSHRITIASPQFSTTVKSTAISQSNQDQARRIKIKRHDITVPCDGNINEAEEPSYEMKHSRKEENWDCESSTTTNTSMTNCA